MKTKSQVLSKQDELTELVLSGPVIADNFILYRFI